jgi:hypothetical protein
MGLIVNPVCLTVRTTAYEPGFRLSTMCFIGRNFYRVFNSLHGSHTSRRKTLTIRHTTERVFLRQGTHPGTFSYDQAHTQA